MCSKSMTNLGSIMYAVYAVVCRITAKTPHAEKYEKKTNFARQTDHQECNFFFSFFSSLISPLRKSVRSVISPGQLETPARIK